MTCIAAMSRVYKANGYLDGSGALVFVLGKAEKYKGKLVQVLIVCNFPRTKLVDRAMGYRGLCAYGV